MATTYDQAARAVRAEIRATVPVQRLRALHRVSGWRHAAVALRQALLLLAAVLAVLAAGDRPWVWIPATVLLGFLVLSLTVLLHEVVHGTVTARRRPALRRFLGLLYAVPAGLSATQFTRWHLDHHRWLGTQDRDPKRRHLTPRIVRRWYKALYLTPALFPLYFRAAGRAAARYPAAVRRRIRWERRLALLFHAGLAALLLGTTGAGAWLKIHALPVFVVFPVAFTLNRLGQHYDVEPSDPARWGTLMKPSPFLWDLLFVWSNYHLEHHLFPGVPCYRLPDLRRALDPFLRGRGIPVRTYAGLLRDWFLRNGRPHTNWAEAAG